MNQDVHSKRANATDDSRDGLGKFQIIRRRSTRWTISQGALTRASCRFALAASLSLSVIFSISLFFLSLHFSFFLLFSPSVFLSFYLSLSLSIFLSLSPKRQFKVPMNRENKIDRLDQLPRFSLWKLLSSNIYSSC